MPERCSVTFRSPAECLIVGPASLVDWRETHQVQVPGAEHSYRYKAGQWDGLYTPGRRLVERPDGWFELIVPRGLLSLLSQTYDLQLSATQLQFQQRIRQRYDAWLENHPRFSTLRDYQQDAIQRGCLEQWGRIALATNAGKGAVLMLLAEFAVRQKMPALIVCDELAVFDALKEQCAEWTTLRLATVESGVKEPPDWPITLAMIPTLSRRLGKLSATAAERRADPQIQRWVEWLSTRCMLLMDEADKATADTWKAVLAHSPNTHWRLGFSGTFPAQGTHAWLKLEEAMGPMLIQKKNLELVEREISARPVVELHSFDVTYTVKHMLRSDYFAYKKQVRNWVYTKAILTHVARHHFIANLIRPGVPTALIVNRIEHGHQLERTVPGAVFLDGSDDQKVRLDTLDRFQRGEFSVLIVTKILDRGTNRLGHVDDLIFVSAEGSIRQTLQRIGRGLRRGRGKTALRLVDIIDRVDLGGSKAQQRAAKYLHGAAKKRIELYRAEGFDTRIGTSATPTTGLP